MMARKEIPFYYCKSRVPLVVFRLRDDSRHVGVIDTGSEVSMFDFGMVEEGLGTVNTQDETNFVGVNGETAMTTVTRVLDTLRFNTKDGEEVLVPVSGLLYDMTGLTEVFRRKLKKDTIKISAIIGADFLKEYDSRIDFRKKTLNVNC